ncbi:Potassium channel AKT2 [Diplonema papillatum]|nr:Potassium channel AKT2 [Diplonema papillatum]
MGQPFRFSVAESRISLTTDFDSTVGDKPKPRSVSVVSHAFSRSGETTVLAKSDETIQKMKDALSSKVLQPDDMALWYWDTLVLASIAYYGVFIPCQYAMRREALLGGSLAHLVVESMATVVFLVDVAVRFKTAFIDEAAVSLVEDSRRIAGHYLTNGFLRDVMAAAPFDLVVLAVFGEGFYHNWPYLALAHLRLLKLLVVRDLFKIITPVKLGPESVSYQFTIVPLLRLVFYCTLAVNTISVLWMLLNKGGPRGVTDDEYSYVQALYWTLYTVTTVGYGDVPVDSTRKQLFASLLFIVGVVVQGVVISKISSRMQKGDVEGDRADAMKETLSVLRKFNIPDQLSCEVLAFQFHQLHSEASSSIMRVLQSLPSVMKNRVELFAKMKFICLVPMFKEVQTECLVGLANALTIKVLEPERIIISAGDDGKEMFFLAHGLAEVTSPEGQHWGIIRPGGFFGEIALLTDSKRTANVGTLTYCKLFRLNRKAFSLLITKHPELRAAVQEEMLKRQIRQNMGVTRYRLQQNGMGDVVGIRWEVENGVFVVADVENESAADRVGIIPGMLLVDMDGEDVAVEDGDEVFESLDFAFHCGEEVELGFLPPFATVEDVISHRNPSNLSRPSPPNSDPDNDSNNHTMTSQKLTDLQVTFDPPSPVQPLPLQAVGSPVLDNTDTSSLRRSNKPSFADRLELLDPAGAENQTDASGSDRDSVLSMRNSGEMRFFESLDFVFHCEEEVELGFLPPFATVEDVISHRNPSNLSRPSPPNSDPDNDSNNHTMTSQKLTDLQVTFDPPSPVQPLPLQAVGSPIGSSCWTRRGIDASGSDRDSVLSRAGTPSTQPDALRVSQLDARAFYLDDGAAAGLWGHLIAWLAAFELEGGAVGMDLNRGKSEVVCLAGERGPDELAAIDPVFTGELGDSGGTLWVRGGGEVPAPVLKKKTFPGKLKRTIGSTSSVAVSAHTLSISMRERLNSSANGNRSPLPSPHGSKFAGGGHPELHGRLRRLEERSELHSQMLSKFLTRSTLHTVPAPVLKKKTFPGKLKRTIGSTSSVAMSAHTLSISMRERLNSSATGNRSPLPSPHGSKFAGGGHPELHGRLRRLEDRSELHSQMLSKVCAGVDSIQQVLAAMQAGSSLRVDLPCVSEKGSLRGTTFSDELHGRLRRLEERRELHSQMLSKVCAGVDSIQQVLAAMQAGSSLRVDLPCVSEKGSLRGTTFSDELHGRLRRLEERRELHSQMLSKVCAGVDSIQQVLAAMQAGSSLRVDLPCVSEKGSLRGTTFSDELHGRLRRLEERRELHSQMLSKVCAGVDSIQQVLAAMQAGSSLRVDLPCVSEKGSLRGTTFSDEYDHDDFDPPPLLNPPPRGLSSLSFSVDADTEPRK